MMEPVLTKEELEAIYSAMNADSGPSKPVDDYSLGSDRAYAQRALRRWASVAKDLGPVWEQVLVSNVGVRGKLDSVEVRTLDDDREPDDGMYRPETNSKQGGFLDTDPDFEVAVIGIDDSRMLMGISRSAAQKYVARRTGAAVKKEEESEESESRVLTWLEKRLLADLFSDLLDSAVKVIPFAKSVAMEKTDPDEFWANREPAGLWVDACVRCSSKPGLAIWLRGPAGSFLPSVTGNDAQVITSVKSAKIQVSAELGRFSMSVYDVWHLIPGTIIPLGTAVGDSLDVYIGGVKKLHGEPMVSRGNIAIRLNGRDGNGAVR